MKRNFPYQKNHVELMPIYNRTHGRNKLSGDGDVALLTHKKVEYLEKQIKSDDTLQSISLEFNVPVSELKRVNNIHKENEIYARKIIKVPSNPFSLLLEREYFSKLESVKDLTPPVPGQVKYDPIVEAVNNCSCNPRTIEEGIEDESDDSERVFKNNTVTEKQEESISLLSATVDNKTNEVISCSGADWGISWHVLILFTLLLGVGGPVFYILWVLWGKSHKGEGS